MLKKSLDCYKENIFNEFSKKWAIVTAGDKKTGFNCLVASWGGLGVLWGKNVAYIFIRKSRYTYDFIEKSESITLSFLSDDYLEAKKIIGSVSGRNCDKMTIAGLNYTYDPDYDGAYIEQATYCFKMKKLYQIDLPASNLDQSILEKYYPCEDFHTMYVCEIKQFLVKED